MEYVPLYSDVTVPAAVWKGSHKETPCVRSAKKTKGIGLDDIRTMSLEYVARAIG